jgi:hypothetical protein
MGDMTEGFRAMSKAAKEKRRTNTAASTNLLAQNDVVYESKNGGAHLIVQGNHHVIDFWPSTGLWIIRGEKTKHRGVYNLLKNGGVKTHD